MMTGMAFRKAACSVTAAVMLAGGVALAAPQGAEAAAGDNHIDGKVTYETRRQCSKVPYKVRTKAKTRVKAKGKRKPVYRTVVRMVTRHRQKCVNVKVPVRVYLGGMEGQGDRADFAEVRQPGRTSWAGGRLWRNENGQIELLLAIEGPSYAKNASSGASAKCFQAEGSGGFTVTDSVHVPRLAEFIRTRDEDRLDDPMFDMSVWRWHPRGGSMTPHSCDIRVTGYPVVRVFLDWDSLPGAGDRAGATASEEEQP